MMLPKVAKFTGASAFAALNSEYCIADCKKYRRKKER